MYVKIVLISLFAVFIQHMTMVVYQLGFHVTVYNHQPGSCRIVPGIEHGSEAIQTSSTGLAFITSGMIIPPVPDWVRQKFENVEGKIFLFDFNHPDQNVTDLKFSAGFDRDNFVPHGMSLFEDPETDQLLLFVVNHYPGTDMIEKFEYLETENMLNHLHTYVDATIMHYINDVAATSSDSFYFTNSGYFRDYLYHLFEVLLFLPFGNVMYYDGDKYTIVAEGLVYPNGIATSMDFNHVYVASATSMLFTIYSRDEDDGLTQIQEFGLQSQPDNINIDADTGNLLIGAHPQAHKSGHHLHYPETPCPSKALLINMKNTSHAESITELYSDDGHLLWGSSSASLYKKQMLIGTVLTKLLYCEVNVL